MLQMPLDEYMSAGTLRDARGALGILADNFEHMKPRLFRVPIDDTYKAIEAILKKIGPVPFEPTLCGWPVSPEIVERPVLVAVADDDTNVEINRRILEINPYGAQTNAIAISH